MASWDMRLSILTDVTRLRHALFLISIVLLDAASIGYLPSALAAVAVMTVYGDNSAPFLLNVSGYSDLQLQELSLLIETYASLWSIESTSRAFDAMCARNIPRLATGLDSDILLHLWDLTTSTTAASPSSMLLEMVHNQIGLRESKRWRPMFPPPLSKHLSPAVLNAAKAQSAVLTRTTAFCAVDVAIDVKTQDGAAIPSVEPVAPVEPVGQTTSYGLMTPATALATTTATKTKLNA
jgi:hypothetical protein